MSSTPQLAGGDKVVSIGSPERGNGLLDMFKGRRYAFQKSSASTPYTSSADSIKEIHVSSFDFGDIPRGSTIVLLSHVTASWRKGNGENASEVQQIFTAMDDDDGHSATVGFRVELETPESREHLMKKRESTGAKDPFACIELNFDSNQVFCISFVGIVRGTIRSLNSVVAYQNLQFLCIVQKENLDFSSLRECSIRLKLLHLQCPIVNFGNGLMFPYLQYLVLISPSFDEDQAEIMVDISLIGHMVVSIGNTEESHGSGVHKLKMIFMRERCPSLRQWSIAGQVAEQYGLPCDPPSSDAATRGKSGLQWAQEISNREEARLKVIQENQSKRLQATPAEEPSSGSSGWLCSPCCRRPC